MPEMTGMELHAHLRALAPELAARTVFLTGGGFTPTAAEFLARVPNPCLEKPFGRAELDAAVARLASPPADAAA